ncbi:hypothetical protein Pcinc_043252 [Petrolisthes cinctipes]|uniref:Uncharacterized protein n=1 Tax=Petrolisthes cinctipes TaxID=88211 RepID=A0AAE1BHY9_PETCI|nr:hypothetical protein Pcinc_043252 [Petrolisthes cinctipes]
MRGNEPTPREIQPTRQEGLRAYVKVEWQGNQDTITPATTTLRTLSPLPPLHSQHHHPCHHHTPHNIITPVITTLTQHFNNRYLPCQNTHNIHNTTLSQLTKHSELPPQPTYTQHPSQYKQSQSSPSVPSETLDTQHSGDI